MFEFIEILSEYEGEIYKERFELYKDGVKYDVTVNRIVSETEEDEIFGDGDSKESFEIFSTNIEMGRKLLNFSIFQFPNNASLTTRLKTDLNGFKFTLCIEKVEGVSKKREILLKFSPILERWNFPYSFYDYRRTFFRKLLAQFSNAPFSINELSDIVEQYNKTSFMVTDKIAYFGKNQDIVISFEHDFSFSSIINEINQYIEICQKLHIETSELLKSVYNDEQFITTFDFPSELKIPCKQYLLYFAQFLQDLGINATSNLKEEAGKVLFSVIPTDDIEALDKIREALAIYLNLPSSPIEYNDSFAAMRLQQQIENLQHSQRMAVRELQFSEKLLIAQSETIREKNLIISQQQSVIEQKDKIIEKISSKSIMIDSAENKEELEEIYNGLKIGESKFLKEQLGIHLNPAKVIKTAVKNTFGKDEKISILDSDEETDKK